MSQAVAESVRHLRVVAVNGTFEIAPWADALAATDIAWWGAHPHAREFAGRKFTSNVVKGIERLNIGPGTCSGVLGLEVAKTLGATRVFLLGCDMHGSHYFGPYTGRLRNTTDARRKVHMAQFAKWGKENPSVQVFNATKGSALQCFPFADPPACGG